MNILRTQGICINISSESANLKKQKDPKMREYGRKTSNLGVFLGTDNWDQSELTSNSLAKKVLRTLSVGCVKKSV